MGIKAKIKLGWDKQRSRDFHQLFINQRIEESQQQHQVQGFLSFPRALGVKVDEPEWNIPVTDLALEFALKSGSEESREGKECRFRRWA